ncbi:hypothetical protein P691DRAFT_539640 [Macrolepiota fuliginosa MF-IS2]|uniref:DUF6534 domain-containing protein n=1 Tax=Macrolepiota fuliginosa MF-IS2 TaxID=1400762 RepID=A0A9P6C5Z0_9AGAR|nr:hypothetical protein P691DRAFT_539640 [Macrolepiota fuliginosa MF-IS2]
MDSENGANALAAPFLGFIVGSIFFGVTILQSYQYYIQYPNDSLSSKIKVATVCLLDFLHFAFSTALMYALLISNSGTISTKNFWSLKALGTTQSILIDLVQMIYLQRIYRLSRIPTLSKSVFRFIKVGICLVALCAVGVATVWCYELQRAKVIIGFNGNTKWVIYLGFGTTALLDTVITAMTCFVLYRNRLEIGIDHISRQSNKLLSNLIRYALATGLITTLASILGMILYLIWPNTLFYVSVAFPITRYLLDSRAPKPLNKMPRASLDRCKAWTEKG